jgi:parallel beta-helix repeat protein
MGEVNIRKIVTVWLGILLCLTGFGVLSIIEGPINLMGNASATTLYVNTTGSGGAYTSIQDAIDNASVGDTVFLYNGLYAERIVINKSITLMGEDKENTQIDGGGMWDTVKAVVDWVNITSLSITGGGEGGSAGGLKLDNANYCRIANNKLYDNMNDGIYLRDSNFTTVMNNNIFSNANIGIRLFRSSWNNISNNIMTFNEDGIILVRSYNSTISHNQFLSNYRQGIHLEYSDNNTFYQNDVLYNDDALTSYTSHNNSFTSNIISWNNDQCISLSSSNNNSFRDNTIVNNNDRIRLLNSQFTKIINNNISSNGIRGIFGSNSDYLNITGNYISDNLEEAISLSSCDHSEITDNIIANSNFGTDIYSSIDINMKGNSFVNCGILFRGNYIEYWNTHDIDTSNTVNGRTVYCWINKTGGTIPPDAGQVILANCSEIIVEKQSLSNSTIGITLGFSSNNVITENEIKDNYYGIYMKITEYNNITNNQISSNIRLGINDVYSQGNTYIGNNFTANDWGLFKYSCRNSTVFHNNFINNIDQTVTDNITCQWDNGYPSGGNYWSDYTGSDIFKGPNQDENGSDGIGDSRYIGSYTIDDYPLMNPFVPDNKNPIIRLISPENNSVIPEGEILDIQITDDNLHEVVYTLDGVNFYNLTMPFNISTKDWADGEYFVDIHAMDRLENHNFSRFLFTIDSTPPSIWFDPDINLSTIPAGQIIELNISDPHLESVQYSVYEGEYVSLESPYDLNTNSWTDGHYKVFIIANDSVGNNAEKWFEVIIDATPPKIIFPYYNYTQDLDNNILNITCTLPFSESMDTSSIEDHISLSLPFDFECIWDTSGKFLFVTYQTDISSDLLDFYITIDSDLTDINGVNLYKDYTFRFTHFPDLDNDGISDDLDPDDDNDGYEDQNDTFPNDPTEWLDTDADGIGNNADTDDDGDGHNDSEDALPLDPSEWADFDSDGIGDNADTDDDGDEVPDEDDYYPLDPSKWEKPAEDDPTPIITVIMIIGIISLILVVMLLKKKKGKGQSSIDSFKNEEPEDITPDEDKRDLPPPPKRPDTLPPPP